MKQVWWLLAIIAVGFVLLFFLLQQKKSMRIPSAPTLEPTNTQSTTFCDPKYLQAVITTEGAAGNIYGTVTIKNISSKNCMIEGNNFVAATFTTPNLFLVTQGDKGHAEIDLSPNQVVYSQIHYPNGPQCQSGITQTPVTFTYQITQNRTVTFASSGNLPTNTVTTCRLANEKTQLDVWSISLDPLH